MHALLELCRRVLHLRQRDTADAELDEEMRFHVELKAREAMARGVGEQEAYRTARAAFGNIRVLRERSHDVWGFPRLETWGRDLA